MINTPLPLVPSWELMWGLSFIIFGLLKGLTWWNRTKPAPAWKQFAYLFGWPGMDADAFLDATHQDIQSPKITEWAFATLKFALGISLISVSGIARSSWGEFAGSWVGMVGIVFVLHFGIFHLLSCSWRSIGIAATPIMDWPVASQNVSEFWGRRWNLAFRDLTHRFVFQPLVRPIGSKPALLMGFIASGLMHDLVISWPAGGGWGLPTSYFVIQALGIFIERGRWGRAHGIGAGLVGRIYCLDVVGLPCPLLFHHAFVDGIIVPFLNAVGSGL